jgi:hypothetical protein
VLVGSWGIVVLAGNGMGTEIKVASSLGRLVIVGQVMMGESVAVEVERRVAVGEEVAVRVDVDVDVDVSVTV